MNIETFKIIEYKNFKLIINELLFSLSIFTLFF
jgi:hypothetical protein